MSDERTRQVVRLPLLGESLTEGVVRFLKKVGEAVQRDELVAELDLDKICVELVAPEAGVIESIMVDDGTSVHIDDALYVLRTGEAVAGPAALPPFASVTLQWDAGHVQTRARALGEPRIAEAALILTALARALAASPGLVRPGREVLTSWVEVEGEAVRRLCAAVPVDVQVTDALLLARASVQVEPPGWCAQLRVVRIVSGPSSGRLPGPGLQVVIGPVRAEAVVRAEMVVVRPMSTIFVATEVGEEMLLRFVAVLAEQLEVV